MATFEGKTFLDRKLHMAELLREAALAMRPNLAKPELHAVPKTGRNKDNIEK